jgi:hypothetical protein
MRRWLASLLILFTLTAATACGGDDGGDGGDGDATAADADDGADEGKAIDLSSLDVCGLATAGAVRDFAEAWFGGRTTIPGDPLPTPGPSGSSLGSCKWGFEDRSGLDGHVLVTVSRSDAASCRFGDALPGVGDEAAIDHEHLDRGRVTANGLCALVDHGNEIGGPDGTLIPEFTRDEAAMAERNTRTEAALSALLGELAGGLEAADVTADEAVADDEASAGRDAANPCSLVSAEVLASTFGLPFEAGTPDVAGMGDGPVHCSYDAPRADGTQDTFVISTYRGEKAVAQWEADKAQVPDATHLDFGDEALQAGPTVGVLDGDTVYFFTIVVLDAEDRTVLERALAELVADIMEG